MRLRSITKNVKKQNWFAVLLDFLIVVLGVFIGVQIGNINENRADKHDYYAALERFKVEAKTNLTTLDKLDSESSNYLKRGSEAFDILLSCHDNPENLEIFNSGLGVIGGTYGIRIHRSALDELTHSEKLLAKQSVELRQRFADAKYYIDLALYEARFVAVSYTHLTLPTIYSV